MYCIANRLAFGFQVDFFLGVDWRLESHDFIWVLRLEKTMIRLDFVVVTWDLT